MTRLSVSTFGLSSSFSIALVEVEDELTVVEEVGLVVPLVELLDEEDVVWVVFSPLVEVVLIVVVVV
jgi:hypothetical protein